MDSVKSLYEFIHLAEKNRKYPGNTAHGKRAALKLFETVLHADELESLELVQERMKEIYLSLIASHKDSFSMQSLNTYKGRLLKLIEDYKKYGMDPKAFTQWEAKARQYKNKDTKKDISSSNSSSSIHRYVHKIQISLQDGQACVMELPAKITKEDVSIITKIVGSLAD